MEPDAPTEAFLREQREKTLRRLTQDDIPKGVLTKVMETWLEIENACADRLVLKADGDG